MNQKIAIAYVYDFLSHLFEEKISLNKVILFGSIARKDFDIQSDIDIFIEPKQKTKLKETEKKIRKIKENFEEEKEHTWGLKGISFPIQVQVGFLNQPLWTNLKQEIISTGIMLYGKYEELPKNLEHFTLINYSLSKLSQKKKMQFLRLIFGYSTKKNQKTYKKKGLLYEYNGKKLSKNVILIPIKEIFKIKKIFEKFKINMEIREIWLRSKETQL